ncbi:MAG TPA: hypothetical protein VJT73_20310 [Polyangiaceae bacterium]|nr:hypothetical protein [Polyangiaceae bacterium]
MVDLGARAIQQRLEEMAALSRGGRRWKAVDMSRDAISARLAELAAASDLCRELARVGRASRGAGATGPGA